MLIQINSLSARISQNPQLAEAINRVLSSGWLVLGPASRQFEREFAEYVGVDHCLGVANGTDAIELALKALGVTRSDRVATAANAGMYTATAIEIIGAEPFFLDVDTDSHGVTLQEVERAILAGVKAVVVTHLYGRAVPDIAAIAKLCADRGILLIEDCAQAHGARINRKCVGGFGDAATFSFYPTKNLGAIGDGGAVVTKHGETAERVARLRQYGWSSKYQVEVAGSRNSRLDELQAAVLSTFLPHLDAANARRREIAARYTARIAHEKVLTPQAAGEAYVAHLYVVRSAHRDSLRMHLRDLQIGSDVHYPIPDYRQPVFKERFANIRLANTERLAGEILTLPCYPEMTDAEVDSVISAVNGWRP